MAVNKLTNPSKVTFGDSEWEWEVSELCIEPTNLLCRKKEWPLDGSIREQTTQWASVQQIARNSSKHPFT
jgi:hypothetical protein